MSKGIVVAEASNLLQQYKQQNHATTAGPFLVGILGTIRSIHDEVPYVKPKERMQFLALLCDYQQFVAGIYKDGSQYERALYYQNKAYAVAKTLQDHEQIALALWRRGLTYDAQKNRKAAISDFLAAQRYQTGSARLDGAIWSSLGHAQAHSAISGAEQTTALQSFDEAEALLYQAKTEPDPYFIKFNAESYFLNRASAWIDAPLKNLRSSSHTLDLLALVPADEDRKRRYGYSAYLQARAWLEDGELPIATQMALDALTAASQIHSQVSVDRINLLYQELKETNFKNSPEVAELGAELARLQNPELFT